MPSPAKPRPTYTSDFIKSDTDRAVFLGSAIADNMMSAIMALSAEVWSVRRRQKIVESLLAKHGSITAEMIEKYVPTPEETVKWQGDRDVFIKTLFEPFSRNADIPYDSSLHFDWTKKP